LAIPGRRAASIAFSLDAVKASIPTRRADARAMRFSWWPNASNRTQTTEREARITLLQLSVTTPGVGHFGGLNRLDRRHLAVEAPALEIFPEHSRSSSKMGARFILFTGIFSRRFILQKL